MLLRVAKGSRQPYPDPQRAESSQMSGHPIDDYAAWIGRPFCRTDTLSPRLIAQFRAVLDDGLAPAEVPLGIFWALCPDMCAPNDLGRDGHPRPGVVLPRLPLPRRMWAGGELIFTGLFQADDLVTRDSRVEAITFKTGSTGPLGFVSVRHEYGARGVGVLSERQDLVYREDPVPSARRPALPNADDLGPPIASYRVRPDAVLLFRYSALTFNGHRIHYDRAYAIDVEGHDDLVVHGPLQATWMLNLAARVMGKCPSRFTYRGVSTPTCGQDLMIEAHPAPQGAIALRVRRDSGPATMTGMAYP